MSQFSTTITGSIGNVVVGDNATLTIGAGPSKGLSLCHKPADDGTNYKARSGYVLVIRNYIFSQRGFFEFTSADDDVDKLRNLFDDFGFKTRLCENLTKSEMLNALRETAEKDFSRYDCFVCVVLSHGSNEGIYGADHEIIKLETITSLYCRDKCPSLKGKPKIFLIQSSWDNECGQIPFKSDSNSIMFSNPSFPAYADFLICFASSPRFRNYGPPIFGSWFISAMFQVFKEYANREHIMDMMLRVNNQVASYIGEDDIEEILCQVCLLTKKIFFEPGVCHAL